MTSPIAFPGLTSEQVRFFEVFGYLRLPGLFRNEVSAISRAFDEAMAAAVQSHEAIIHIDKTHYDAKRTILPSIIEKHPYLLSLLTDYRIHNIANSLAGEDFNYLSSDGNIFTGDTAWHRDIYGLVRQHRYVKISFYLEDIDGQSGALRVIPGSHHLGQVFSKMLLDSLPDPTLHFGLKPEEIPSQIINNEPGDVIVFDYNIQHATCHSHFPRRMFSMGTTAHFPDGKKQLAVNSIKELLGNKPSLYGPAILNHPDPSVQQHIAQMLKLENIARQQAITQAGQDTPVPPKPQ
ncbi:MAG TPA: phytanoyl-CoA dioxygenase family protein [Pseudomonadales bacterium]